VSADAGRAPRAVTGEAALVAELEPPFNLAVDPAHPLHSVVQAARKRWREAAKRDGHEVAARSQPVAGDWRGGRARMR
jgi:hypothetical protein